MYGMSHVASYKPGDTFDISQVQEFTGMTFTPRYINAPVSAYLEHIAIEGVGPKAAFSLIDAKLQAAALTISAKLAVDIFMFGQLIGSTDRTLMLNGLAEALSDGTTNDIFGNTYATYGTLTRNDANIGVALNAPMTGPTANIGATITYPLLEQAWNSVVFGQEYPDLLVTTNNGLSFIKMAFQAQQRFEGPTQDFGFQGVKFNGSVILQDRYAPGQATPSAQELLNFPGFVAQTSESLWILNSKYIKFYASVDPLYKFGFTGFMPSNNSSLVVGHYRYGGNLVVTGPRYSRVLFGFTA